MKSDYTFGQGCGELAPISSEQEKLTGTEQQAKSNHESKR
jgi:hypothetical protein